MSKRHKVIILFAGYFLYFLLAVSCFKAGAPFLFPIGFCFQTLLAAANYYIFEKKRLLILFDMFLLGDVILSHYIAVRLYTSFVSSDAMSYAVGMWGAAAGVIYVLILSVILAYCRFQSDHTDSENCDKNI